MVGKKNIIFGFFFLIFTASLGGVMVNKYAALYSEDGVNAVKQKDLGRLQNIKSNNYEEELDPISADKLAKANTDGLMALNNWLNAKEEINNIKARPHAHGNLESLLNIVVGIWLGFITISRLFKQIISWVFILGAVFHSGMMYLQYAFDMAWAGQVNDAGVGPILLLIGLLLAGIATIMGYDGKPAQD